MGVRDRRARQKAQLRQQILDAARELLVKHGYDGLSMRKVAERIEYSATAIYLHFKDKDALIFELCEETFTKLVRELETLPDEFADPSARLAQGLRRYIAFGLRHPQHYLASFVMPNTMTNPEHLARAQAPDSMGMRALGILRQTVAECVRARRRRGVDVDMLTRALWTAVHGVTALFIVYDTFPWGSRQAVIGAVVDGMIAGHGLDGRARRGTSRKR